MSTRNLRREHACNISQMLLHLPDIATSECLLGEAHFGGAGVGGEAFAVGQDAGDFAQLLRALLRYLYQARALLEIVHAQW